MTPPPTNSQPPPQAPTLSTDAVLKPSAPIPPTTHQVTGVEFNDYPDRDITVAELVSSMSTAGFQSSAVADAVRIINRMRRFRDPATGAKTTLFLGYTSNLVSSGLRATLRYLVQHRHVSAIVTTAGGIEEDLIKCLAPTYLSSFTAPGAALRAKGLNRIGNLVVPNSNYCAFEDWLMPILDTLLAEQESSRETAATDADRLVWTPSAIIARLGAEIDNESSILYWAHRNAIPIFCPALTDGSLGDMLYFHSYRSSPAILDISITRDIRILNDLAINAARADMIVLGGGIVKHHIANACLMRNGAEGAVFVNTGQEFDGSDAGARPDEAVSWGKIKAGGGGGGEGEREGEREGENSVKVYGEATVVFPLIVAATFAKAGQKEEEEGGG